MAIVAMTDAEQRLTDLIPLGRDRIKTQRTLAAEVGMSVRGLQRVLKRMTDDGLPVCSSVGKPPGVFVATTTGEVERYVEQLAKRARSCVARIAAVRPAAAARLIADMAIEPYEAPGQRAKPDLPRTAKLRPGQRKSDGVPNGKKCWCGAVLRGRQTRACSDAHRDIANGRRRMIDASL